jgi:S-adenosylmethionine:tRNA ribosyltransferase-isomerase
VLDYLSPGDLLVVNDTKVLPARLLGETLSTGTPAEVLLLHPLKERDDADDPQIQHWEALVRPGRRLKPSSRIGFGPLEAEVVDWVEEEGKGRRVIRLSTSAFSSVGEAIQELGALPLPPYITDYRGDTSLYQTVYAHEQNSAAAPTAGLHFSEELLAQVREKGCELATVNLEIGLDTFRTVDEENIADHRMHSERYTVSSETVEAVKATKRRGGRVIAVGTTAVRSLESAAQATGELREVSREETRLYITPGYAYRVVDALITNFHTPRSTLLMLVSAFAGHATMKEAYLSALEERYRFLSFGDAMLIV